MSSTLAQRARQSTTDFQKAHKRKTVDTALRLLLLAATAAAVVVFVVVVVGFSRVATKTYAALAFANRRRQIAQIAARHVNDLGLGLN